MEMTDTSTTCAQKEQCRIGRRPRRTRRHLSTMRACAREQQHVLHCLKPHWFQHGLATIQIIRRAFEADGSER